MEELKKRFYENTIIPRGIPFEIIEKCKTLRDVRNLGSVAIYDEKDYEVKK